MRILQWEPFDERERARAGDLAEMEVRRIISSYGEGVLLRGPLVPDIDQRGYVTGYRESDFLVYTQGTVFCIEVKNYAGTILPGYDATKIVQMKPGRRGGPPVERVYSHPLRKTKSFISLLKKYIRRVEPRFQGLFIIPVVCFSSQADIRAVSNFQDGMIQIEHLPQFILQHRNEQFAARPTPWITETILHKIPNWDRVQILNGEWINGILVEPHLTFFGPDGRPYILAHYTVIKEITWQRTYAMALASMIVSYTNGGVQTLLCAGGQLSLIRGERPEVFDLRTVQRLVVGLANKMVV